MAVHLRLNGSDSAQHVWLDLGSGVKLRCRPYDAEDSFAALEVARARFRDQGRMEQGTEAFGRYWFTRIAELAIAVTDDWEGVVDEEGNEVPFSPEHLRLALHQEPGLAESFDIEYRLRVLEKKDSSSGPNGAGREESPTAQNAGSSTSRARGAKRESTARSARS